MNQFRKRTVTKKTHALQILAILRETAFVIVETVKQKKITFVRFFAMIFKKRKNIFC